jgi:hypothetical protein
VLIDVADFNGDSHPDYALFNPNNARYRHLVFEQQCLRQGRLWPQVFPPAGASQHPRPVFCELRGVNKPKTTMTLISHLLRLTFRFALLSVSAPTWLRPGEGHVAQRGSQRASQSEEIGSHRTISNTAEVNALGYSPLVGPTIKKVRLIRSG